jgi:uncharacterized protein (TIGR02646 family)
MKKLKRPALGRKAMVWLFLRTKEILREPESKRYEKANRLWKSANDVRNTRKHRYQGQVKKVLEGMTSGLLCMYCEHNVVHQIEHFWPREQYPERTFCWDNLLYVCGQCNTKKNKKFACNAFGEPLYIDPTNENDDPDEHLELVAKEGRFTERDGSEKGKNTKEILNQFAFRRKEAWDALPVLVVSYARARKDRDENLANALRKDLMNRPFSELIRHLVLIVGLPDPERYMKREYVETVRSCAIEIQDWIGNRFDGA